MAKPDHTFRKLLRKVLSPIRTSGILVPAIVPRHLHYRGVVQVKIDSKRGFKIQAYGSSIENRLYWQGKFGHEPETFLPWLKASENAGIVFDIGANTGLYSLGAAASNPGSRVFAFEPVPRIAELARINAQLNPGLGIEVCEVAVCEKNGFTVLHDPGGDQPTSASLVSDFLSCEKEEVRVRSLRIDDFVTERELTSVDLIKLDVEGIEELALQGMRNTLQRFMPDLFIEVLDDRPALVRELNKLLEAGYEVGQLHARGVRPYSLKNTNQKRSERNLLFTTALPKYLS